MKLLRVDLNNISQKGLKAFIVLLEEGAEEFEPEGGVALPLAYPIEDDPEGVILPLEIPDEMPDDELEPIEEVSDEEMELEKLPDAPVYKEEQPKPEESNV